MTSARVSTNKAAKICKQLSHDGIDMFAKRFTIPLWRFVSEDEEGNKYNLLDNNLEKV